MTANPRDIVLLVDDSPDTLGFLTEALEAQGYSVLIATSGQSALSIAGRITPDIVLMDAVMPGLDGFATCRQLKANAAVADVPVIFLTGLTETEHVVHALAAGGVDYVTKPINIDELIARMRVHLANARSAQSTKAALDASGRHLMAVRRSGQVHWSTPQAGRLADRVIGGDGALESVARRLADMLAERPSGQAITITGADGASLQAGFVSAIGPDEYLFRLTAGRAEAEDEVLRKTFSLTAREAEVLAWIAKGKANRDIGEILGLSARTVNKHLEQIYVKLGVENRASAAVKAAAILMQGD